MAKTTKNPAKKSADISTPFDALVDPLSGSAAVGGPAPMPTYSSGLVSSSSSAPPHTMAAGATMAALHSPSDPDADLMGIIRKYGAAYKDIMAMPAPTEKTDEYKPVQEIPDGYVSLSSLINNCDDVPVKVFNSSDWPEEIRSYIPDSLPNQGQWHWDIDLANQFAEAMFHGDRTLLHGPTGTGKSAFAEAWCFLCQIPLIRVNCHREMQSTDFLGKDIIKSTPQGPVLEYDWSLTTLAAKFGGMLLIDEAFRSPHLMAIQSLLERNGTLTLPDAASLTPAQRKIVPPQGKSFVVLTDNTVGTGDDTGSYVSEVQDTSTLDRITAAMFVGYVTPEDDARFLGEDFPKVPKHVLKNLCEWTSQMRTAFVSRKIQQPISRRGVTAILRKYETHGNLARAVRISYVNKLSKVDAHQATEAWKQVFGTELEAA